MTDRVAVLGIRHHGPGSARSVRAELDRRRPEMVLIEGPADADPLLALAADPELAPPVALLGYASDAPRISAFWPFAIFSPEWQAMSWAAANGVPVRFCDLPTTMVLAQPGRQPAPAPQPDAEPQPAPDGELPPAADHPLKADDAEPAQITERLRADPIASLAAAAGYDDPERWWDDVIESRLDGQSPFEALTEAMAELRLAAPARSTAEATRENQREAHMRQVLRSALKQTSGQVAVVCGAWHAPALSGALPTASADAALLRGIAKRKTTITWVPWTHSRLAASSGYGAGITSPGWYHHLFTAPDRPVTRWLTQVAGVLRARDLPVSSAHVIEAVRLADCLATLRGRPLAGLAEVNEATEAVLCEGDPVAAAFVTLELVLGERLGAVPASAPVVPLETDLRHQAKSLRLKPDPLAKVLSLDLRKDLDQARSVFFHRLKVLGVDWATATEDRVRGTGTFHETWSLQWQPELSVAIIDAALWGTTVAAAAIARLIDIAQSATDLAAVTAAVEACLLADLSDALPPVLRALDDKAARDADVAHLMAAVPALVRAVRYGDVRGSDTATLTQVVDALTVRICAGLPAAVGNLADDAAVQLRQRIDRMHAALALHSHDESHYGTRELWLDALAGLVERRDVHGLLLGRCVRLLHDHGTLSKAEAARRFAAHLSIGVPAADKAAWAEGFLSGGGLLLVHDRELLQVLDSWLARLAEPDFLDALPLLRRTFGEFSPAERSNLGDAVKSLSGPARTVTDRVEPVDERRAAAALATVAAILSGAR